MKEKETKIIHSLGSLFMVAISFLGGHLIEKTARDKNTYQIHIEVVSPVFTQDSERSIQRTPAYTPARNGFISRETATALIISATEEE